MDYPLINCFFHEIKKKLDENVKTSRMSEVDKKSVLHEKYCKGPHGLGDPDDKTLRKVETEVMIPKKMREIAKIEKCGTEAEQFTECCKDNSVLMVLRCRKENAALKQCLTRWYNDEAFKDRCTKEYLDERADYRRTGITKKQQQRVPSAM